MSETISEFRKIQRVGNRGFTVSIPKSYIKVLKWKAHDLIKASLEEDEVILKRIQV